MHVRQIRLQSFRRFTDLTIDLGDAAPSLVMLCGPNGSGKSSLFDALRLKVTMAHGGWQSDLEYYLKAGRPRPFGDTLGADQVVVAFQSAPTAPGPPPRTAVYVRSAYRNEPEFAVSSVGRPGSAVDGPQVSRMIENDARVADNYQRLVGQTIADLYGGSNDMRTGLQIREELIGQLRDVTMLVFPDLELIGPGDPLGGGTFRFRKGVSADYAYKNLSGGEKAVFDILLDLLAKRPTYNDTVFCIDEPEAHVNPRVHGALLDAMLTLLPPNSQLWLATHSVGMMRRARDLQLAEPQSVAFLDFDVDFDQAQTLAPISVDRQFWRRTLTVAFGDMAELVAPERVVLCEGQDSGGIRKDFDARCYRVIFGQEFPDTEFLAVGNDQQVQSDLHGIGRAVEVLAPGTVVERVIDRDDRSDAEVAEAAAAGTRVLGRRHLESYLLDDEVLEKLCASVEKPERWPELQAAARAAITASIAPPRNNSPDDLKSCAGDIFNAAKRLLGLVAAGNSKDAFMRDTLAPLLTPGMVVYSDLAASVLGA